MLILVFLIGALLGMLVGGGLCVRYVRQEMTGDIGPKLGHVQLQLDNLESAVGLALAAQYAELAKHLPRDPAS
jgi:hypothetical protein